MLHIGCDVRQLKRSSTVRSSGWRERFGENTDPVSRASQQVSPRVDSGRELEVCP